MQGEGELIVQEKKRDKGKGRAISGGLPLVGEGLNIPYFVHLFQKRIPVSSFAIDPRVIHFCSTVRHELNKYNKIRIFI